MVMSALTVVDKTRPIYSVKCTNMYSQYLIIREPELYKTKVVLSSVFLEENLFIIEVQFYLNIYCQLKG